MADLDLDLLASIASGGLGRWVQDAAGRTVYVKSDDCIGAGACRGGRAGPPPQAPTARRRSRPCTAAARSTWPPPARPPPAACLRDLQRFLRDDEPEGRPAFFAASRYGFARSDLVPLIVTYPGAAGGLAWPAAASAGPAAAGRCRGAALARPAAAAAPATAAR